MARPRSAAALTRQPVPRHPRRVSGPVARPRPVPVPGQPRGGRGHVPVVQPHPTFGATLRALPDHRLLDTLLRSRAWIWLLGIALGGIVFMQVSLLGMNSGIGRAVGQSTELQNANAQLRDDVAQLTSGPRLQAFAKQRGLVSPAAVDVDYLKVRPGVDPARGAGRMTPPSDQARADLAAGGGAAATTTTTAAATAAPTAVPTAAATAVPTAVATAAPTVAPAATAAAPVTPAATVAPTTATAPTVPASSVPGAVEAP